MNFEHVDMCNSFMNQNWNSIWQSLGSLGVQKSMKGNELR